jgi:hypothetical protein
VIFSLGACLVIAYIYEPKYALPRVMGEKDLRIADVEVEMHGRVGVKQLRLPIRRIHLFYTLLVARAF